MGAYRGIEEVIELWAKGLALEMTETTERIDLSPPRKSKVIFQRFFTGADATEVRFYQLRGGRHDWPEHLGNESLSTAGEIWEFFSSHRQ